MYLCLWEKRCLAVTYVSTWETILDSLLLYSWLLTRRPQLQLHILPSNINFSESTGSNSNVHLLIFWDRILNILFLIQAGKKTKKMSTQPTR